LIRGKERKISKLRWFEAAHLFLDLGQIKKPDKIKPT